jgi:hypothetical protein
MVYRLHHRRALEEMITQYQRRFGNKTYLDAVGGAAWESEVGLLVKIRI